MEQAREIVRQYAQANFSKRIYLFLQFPGLRDTFQEIERKRYYVIPPRSNSIAKGNVPGFHCSSVELWRWGD